MVPCWFGIINLTWSLLVMGRGVSRALWIVFRVVIAVYWHCILDKCGGTLLVLHPCPHNQYTICYGVESTTRHCSNALREQYCSNGVCDSVNNIWYCSIRIRKELPSLVRISISLGITVLVNWKGYLLVKKVIY